MTLYPSGKPRNAAVVGTGLVGISCACALRRAGFDVTTLDPNGVGAGSAKGSTGIFATTHVAPFGTPALVKQLRNAVEDPLGGFVIRPDYLIELLPWLTHFIQASTPERVEELSVVLAGALKLAVDSFRPLLGAGAFSTLIARPGWLYAYQTDESFTRAEADLEIKRRRGVRVEIHSGQTVGELEPALAHGFKHAAMLPDAAQAADPEALARALGKSFADAGGEVVQDSVDDFVLEDGAVTGVKTARAVYAADLVVVAAGIRSAGLAARLGSNIPHSPERGYQVNFADPGVTLRRPVSTPEFRCVAASVAAGLCFTSTAEFTRPDAPPNYGHTDRLAVTAPKIFPALRDKGHTRWHGERSATPDSLPVIGRSPRHPSVIYAFGHGHLGLTLAALTGRLVAEIALGQKTAIDTGPFRPDRFDS